MDETQANSITIHRLMPFFTFCLVNILSVIIYIQVSILQSSAILTSIYLLLYLFSQIFFFIVALSSPGKPTFQFQVEHEKTGSSVPASLNQKEIAKMASKPKLNLYGFEFSHERNSTSGGLKNLNLNSKKIIIANEPMNISNVEKPEKYEKNEQGSATSNLILTELKNARKYNVLENSDIFSKGSNLGKDPNIEIIKDKDNSADLKISQITTKGKDDHQLAPEDNEYKRQISEELEAEPRFCTICCIVQPLRTKHCGICNNCVNTFDHHCNWVGNCIGINNKLKFIIYINLQHILVLYCLILVLIFSFQNGNSLFDFFKLNWINITLVCILGYFEISIGLLSVFHLFLITQNLTTWEMLSWEHITYLKKWPIEYNSPFDEGLIENMKIILCNKNSDNISWKIPKSLPKYFRNYCTVRCWRKVWITMCGGNRK